MTVRAVRKFLVLAVGLTLLLAGAALLVLPGPGIPVVLVALALLATEFLWARSLVGRIRAEAEKLRRRKRKNADGAAES